MNGRRFIYNAKGVGVGANFGGPNSLRQFWASQALPDLGGTHPPVRQAGPSGNPVLKFDWAETELSGNETSPGVHDTEVRVEVQNLDILSGGITADRVKVTLKWRCDLNTGNAQRSVPSLIGANGTLDPFVNLRIAGAPVRVNLDSAFANDVAENYAAFRTALAARAKSITKNPRDGGPPFHTAFTHLVQLPNTQVSPSPTVPPHDFGVVYNGTLPTGITQIYLHQWMAVPDQQSLTIMRVKLAANLGEIVICDPTGNGEDVP